MRSVVFVERLELDFEGNLFANAVMLGDVDNDGVSARGVLKKILGTDVWLEISTTTRLENHRPTKFVTHIKTKFSALPADHKFNQFGQPIHKLKAKMKKAHNIKTTFSKK